MLDLLAQGRRAAVFVCDAGGGKLVGFLEVSIREPIGEARSAVVGYVEGWYVRPRFRRRGLGAALILAAETWTARNGLRELASSTEVANRTSIRVHRRLGFEESFRLVHFVKKV